MQKKTYPSSNGRRNTMLGAAAILSSATVGLNPAVAQSSDSPIKIAVGFPPGGSGDLFARILADGLREELSRPVLIENKPGGGGMTVALGFLRSPKDGSQLMLATGSTAISAPISRAKLPYNSVEDFTWIALLSNAPFVIAVNPTLPVKTLKELVAYAKTQPGKLSYGHAGLGTTVHLAAELFKERAGIHVVEVAYAGSAGAIVDTIAGNVQFIVETSGTLLPHHKSGKLRIITTMGETREKNLPDIATARESGYDILAGTCNLLAAPLGQLGIQPISNSNPAKARAYVAGEIARWTPVVKKLGIAL
jgi:tripartite-type tricarboxylate transporter receptor subunit TctC